jgi:glycopeptide antibiotics resistance protein
VSNYLLRGTFDVGDLIAATLGALAAALLLFVIHGWEVSRAN